MQPGKDFSDYSTDAGQSRASGALMKKVIAILLCAAAVYGGRTSQWSSTFTLREPINTVLSGRTAGMQNRFDLTIRPNRSGPSALLFVGGVNGGANATLRIYGVDGRLVADLSGLVQSGASQVVWVTRQVSSGIFIARLQSGARIKTVRFILPR
jgi:hypothetical protein